ncbi:MAG TPA: metallophosphoesterase [Vicinamibacterales bacterium]|jgi:hypothetical protein
MPEYHAEPYIYLPQVNHSSVLVAWGAFYFRVRSGGRMKLVDEDDLDHIHPPRKDTIGAQSAPYGPARVEVFDGSGALVTAASTHETNHCWVTDLAPDTAYTYRLIVKDELWADGQRWDWSPEHKALVPGRTYVNAFKTNPHPRSPAPSLEFAIIGDFGVGVKDPSAKRPQQYVANALVAAAETHDIRFLLTTGDNIYAGKHFFGIVPIAEHGDEDDDWFFTYFQPYRYIINRICTYPSIGNHDTGETEEQDDRDQVEDNFYIRERLSGPDAASRASLDPGMFYRFAFGSTIELVCLDTSKERFFGKRLFDHPNHQSFIESAFAAGEGSPRWRIPFCHHPPFSAGPRHHNTESLHRLIPLFQRAGVRAVFSGHEHNFQHSVVDGIHYFVSGAAGKSRSGTPDEFVEAQTQSWSAKPHFLHVRIAEDAMHVRAIGGVTGVGDPLAEIERRNPAGTVMKEPIVIRLV